MTQSVLEAVDLSEHRFTPQCDHCPNDAVYIGQGCGDAKPVLVCQSCYQRGLDVIKTYVRTWMKANKRVMICGECNRPMLHLDTHLEVKKLPT